MNQNFQITPIHSSQVDHILHLSETDYAKLGVVKMIVAEKPGYPCRVSLADAEIGEEVFLFPYQHHATASPYQSTGPIFIRKNVLTAQLAVNETPLFLQHRLLSLRGYDTHGMMQNAKTIAGTLLTTSILELFEHAAIDYIQIHNASYGCYMCQVNRVIPC